MCSLGKDGNVIHTELLIGIQPLQGISWNLYFTFPKQKFGCGLPKTI